MKSENQRIFKFRAGNEYDLDALENDYLWFSKLSELNDPYEGYVRFSHDDVDDHLRIKFLKSVFSKEPKEGVTAEEEVQKIYFESLHHSPNSFAEYVDKKCISLLQDYYKDHINNTFVFSASLTKEIHKYPAPLNSMMMWSHYANGFRGYCLEYDFNKLVFSIREENGCDIGYSRVRYALDGLLPVINLKTFIQDHNLEDRGSSLEILQALRTKEKGWNYENEVRLISDSQGKMKIKDEAINCIYVTEKTPKEILDKITKKIRKSKGRIKLVAVYLHNKEYKLGYKDITNSICPLT